LNLFSLFNRRSSAPVARERLQILLSHERAERGRPDLLVVLREEILAVVGRHIAVEQDKVRVKMTRDDDISTLEIDIEVPNAARARVLLHA